VDVGDHSVGARDILPEFGNDDMGARNILSKLGNGYMCIYREFRLGIPS